MKNNTIRDILEKLVQKTNEKLDKKDGMSLANVNDINQAEKEIKDKVKSLVPEETHSYDGEMIFNGGDNGFVCRHKVCLTEILNKLDKRI